MSNKETKDTTITKPDYSGDKLARIRSRSTKLMGW